MAFDGCASLKTLFSKKKHLANRFREIPQSVTTLLDLHCQCIYLLLFVQGMFFQVIALCKFEH